MSKVYFENTNMCNVPNSRNFSDKCKHIKLVFTSLLVGFEKLTKMATEHDLKNIALHMDTFHRLRRLGYAGEPYDRAVRRLLDEHEKEILNNRALQEAVKLQK